VKTNHIELALRAYFNCSLGCKLSLIDSTSASVDFGKNIPSGAYTLQVSESPPVSISKTPIYFNLTGFGEFNGVKDNPTQTLMRQLTSLLTKETSIFPSHIRVENITVLETAGKSSKETFDSLTHSPVVDKKASSTEPTTNRTKCVWLHFGVASSYKEFALESHAYNQADFRVPDQLGWMPRGELIIRDTKPSLQTQLPIQDLFQVIRCYGDPVKISVDPGRFVCNWIYFHSLHRAWLENTSSLFVHVPPFETIPFESQLNFALRLINLTAEILQ